MNIIPFIIDVGPQAFVFHVANASLIEDPIIRNLVEMNESQRTFEQTAALLSLILSLTDQVIKLGFVNISIKLKRQNC